MDTQPEIIQCIRPEYHQYDDNYRNQLFDYFLCKLNRTLKDEELEQIRKAYDFAFEAHRGQMRKAEKIPYINHPVEVAIIVANEMDADLTSIISAFLHDVIEDNQEITYEDVKREFGEKVAEIVSGVTKMTRIGGKNDPNNIAAIATLKKVLASFIKDIRVLYIKIADRLHNMRTMEGMPQKKQRAKSAENLLIYAPFAGLLGFEDIKIEMENLSFKYLEPDKFFKIKQHIDTLSNYKDQQLNHLKETIHKIIFNKFKYLNYYIKIEQKSIFQIWQELKEIKFKNQNPQDITAEEIDNVLPSLKDIFDFKFIRIIVDHPTDIKNTIFQLFAEITTYINYAGYMQLVELPDLLRTNGKFQGLEFHLVYEMLPITKRVPALVKVQILTKSYYEKIKKGKLLTQEIVNKLLKLEKLDSQDDSIIDMINSIKQAIQTDKIYVFTPKGEVKTLPKGSTVLDFAFAVHTELGLQCLGAKINMRETKPITYKLNNGDVVEILTSPNKKPELDWLNIVVTDKAKREIKKYFKLESKKIKTEVKDYIEIDSSTGYKLASCCNPLPGDDAIAVIENGTPVIHKSNCIYLPFFDKEAKLAKVIWNFANIVYSIKIKAQDRRRLLKDLIEIISNEFDINMQEVHMKRLPNDEVEGLIKFKFQKYREEECRNDGKSFCPKDYIIALTNKLKNVQGITEVSIVPDNVVPTSSKKPDLVASTP